MKSVCPGLQLRDEVSFRVTCRAGVFFFDAQGFSYTNACLKGVILDVQLAEYCD